MSNVVSPKLAAVNLRKQHKMYLPYIISAVITVAMFYVLSAISYNEGIMNMTGGSNLKLILRLGCIVIGIFSLIFLLYTNSFLTKQRKKEFGLYCVLGMEKKHISKIMFFESVYTFLITMIFGIAFGLVFDKLITLILCKMLRFTIQLGFSVSLQSIILTACVFGMIFLISLISNIVRVGKTNPVDLLHGGSVGEKEPKTKIILAILGVIFLAVGYGIAITVKSPLDAIFLFFIAVLCVIFGTYLLFMAGSIAFLKILRKNKTYYYDKKHFNSVSGMLYRMKQNAVGLANICILATMVLVMVSTTVSLYAGTEDSLLERYPKDITVNYNMSSDGNTDKVVLDSIEKTAKDRKVSLNNLIQYKYLNFSAVIEDGNYTSGSYNDASVTSSKVYMMCIITEDTYQKMTGEKLNLKDGELALYSNNAKPEDNIKIFTIPYSVKHLESFPSISDMSVLLTNVYCIAVKDNAALQDIYTRQLDAYGTEASHIQNEIDFDISGTDDEKIEDSKWFNSGLVNDLHATDNNETYFTFACRQANRAEIYEMNGSFLFLGIVLGVLFLMVTVMIIYYKQVSEGYDDRERFRIMQNVGMSKDEVKKSIRSQVLTVFFLPLVTAYIHLAFSFPIIRKMLALFNLMNVNIFIISLVVTSVVFAIIYAIVYIVTSKTYYKIVSE